MSFIHNHRLIRRGGLEPETLTALAKMTVKPSIEDAFNYDLWIKEIKEGHALALGVNSLAPTFRLLQISACHHPQVAVINWVPNGFDGVIQYGNLNTFTVGGSLAWTPYKATGSIGTANGPTTTYIFFNGSIMLDNLRLNCTFGHYNYNDLAVGQAWASGQSNGSWNLGIVRNATPNILARINATNGVTWAVAVGGALGLISTKRTSNTQTIYQNTTLRVSGTVTDIGTIAGTNGFGIHCLARNNDMVGQSGGPLESCHFYGVYAIDLGVMKSAIENYMNKYP